MKVARLVVRQSLAFGRVTLALRVLILLRADEPTAVKVLAVL